jgi:hypothetical protein
MLNSSTIMYLFAGAILFSTLGLIATYYRDDKPTGISVGRDFVAGGIIVVFLKAMIPSFFPELSLTIPGIPSFDQVMARRVGGASDYELQL